MNIRTTGSGNEGGGIRMGKTDWKARRLSIYLLPIFLEITLSLKSVINKSNGLL